MEQYLVIYQDYSPDYESDPDFLVDEKQKPILFDTIEQATSYIKEDIETWKSSRPNDCNARISEDGVSWSVMDEYDFCCNYYIRKIFI